MNKEEGLKALETSIKAIQDVITNKKGTFVLQQAVSSCSINAMVVFLLLYRTKVTITTKVIVIQAKIIQLANKTN